MKILLIHNYYSHTGGEDIYFQLLSKLLSQKGHEVLLYTKNSAQINLKNLTTQFNVGVGMFWNNQTITELTAIIKNNKPDVAHVHNVYPLISPTVYFLCKKFNVPIIQTIHNYRFMCPKGILFRNNKVCELCPTAPFPFPAIKHACYHNSRIASTIFASASLLHQVRRTFDLIDAFIFPSAFTKNYYIKHSPNLSQKKIYLLPHFIDIATIKPLPHIKRDNYFLFVGRLSEEKGILPLLQIFADNPHLKLIALGDGPLKNEVAQYKKYKNINLRPFSTKKTVFSYMRKALATVIPSMWFEVLPLVLVESFSQNTPVIAPNFGTFPQVIKNNKTGIFYKRNDWRDLAVKLNYLLKNKQQIANMETFIKKEYEKKYSPERHYTILNSIYRNIST